MFPMIIYKLIPLFLIIIFLTNCSKNYAVKNSKENVTSASDYGNFLSARYSFKIGDNFLTTSSTLLTF